MLVSMPSTGANCDSNAAPYIKTDQGFNALNGRELRHGYGWFTEYHSNVSMPSTGANCDTASILTMPSFLVSMPSTGANCDDVCGRHPGHAAGFNALNGRELRHWNMPAKTDMKSFNALNGRELRLQAPVPISESDGFQCPQRARIATSIGPTSFPFILFQCPQRARIATPIFQYYFADRKVSMPSTGANCDL